MAVIEGPELDRLKDAVKMWYVTKRQDLINALEAGGYPYRNVQLSPSEQLSRYRAMTPQDRSQMVAMLTSRYRGMPNWRQLVDDAMTAYDHRMAVLGETLAKQGQSETVAPFANP